MGKQFITLQEARRRIKINRVSYKPITLFKKIVAYSFITYGIVTLPLPTGSQLAIVGGCWLLGINYKILLNTIKSYCGASVGVLGVLWFRFRVWYKIRRVC